MVEKKGKKSINKITQARLLASKLHQGQYRQSGEPYFTHCIEVDKIIHKEWGIKNKELRCAAFLHDSIEDTPNSFKEIQLLFGPHVAELVDGVTKLKSSTDKETVKKLLHTTHLNPLVAILKLADRLHNMRTLEFKSRQKQIEKATETLDVFSRLAESLGMWEVKKELEDLCFQYLDPQGYEKTQKLVESDPRLNQSFTSYLNDYLKQILKENNIKGNVNLRVNGLYSLKKKQERLSLQGRCSPFDFNDINDLLSIRITAKKIEDCYLMLYKIHNIFGYRVDYDRYDEFIGANKRVNGYQAIQTTINFYQGPVEIAFMTKQMEDFNSWGVVSLVKKGEVDLKNFILKLVFTPSGTVRFLPKDATGVDFALTINSQVLAEAESMLIDGKEKPLISTIPNSSTVEIIVGEPRRAPLLGVEDFAMPQTKTVIMELRHLDQKDHLIIRGMKIMESILSKRGLLVLTDLDEIIVNPILYKLGCLNADDLYFKIGKGSITRDLFSKELNLAKIDKQNLKLTTIRVIGSDQPGVLNVITQKIRDLNKNIYLIRHNRNNAENKFNMRILINDLTKDDENKIIELLNQDSRFEEKTIV